MQATRPPGRTRVMACNSSLVSAPDALGFLGILSPPGERPACLVMAINAVEGSWGQRW